MSHSTVVRGTRDVELEQRGWVIGGSPRLGGDRPVKSEIGHIQLADERVDHANRVVLINVLP
jgi:hypothetical protein